MNEPEKAIAGLYALAQSASDNAYSPYSGVRVGACREDESGNVYSGCNVENSSYGLTQCAERNALAAAIAAGMQPGTAHTLLIYATGFETLAPCGACRQFLYEMMADNIWVISCCDGDGVMSWTKEEYLPDAFVPEKL